MEPELQKLATAALVGLLFLFPVFNQVAASSLEALRDADHKAKFNGLLKKWNDIPADEKLSYYDGRTQPPGKQGDFDRDRIDDDARIHRPQDDPDRPDRDGDGVPDDEDPQPDDPAVTDETPARWVTHELFHFRGAAGAQERADDVLTDGRFVYEYVNVTGEIEGFTGSALFTLAADGTTKWTKDINFVGTYQVGHSEDPIGVTFDDIGADELVMDYNYDPLGEPAEFWITITGAYREYGER